MTKIDIISGFLGAGKTTLIKKMIEEVFKGQKIVLIENEFGEIGIDGGFLKDAGIEITEMNSGCICCTLVGDFDKNLKEVLEKFHPERILIEPSGVGKLSDVMKSVIDLEKERDVKLNGLVTVVNAAKASKQMKAFGEFFNNQIEFASTIVLSRSQNVSAQKLELCVKQMQELNPKAAIITTPWDEISAEAILKVIEQTDSLEMELMAEARHAQEAAEHAHHHHDHNGHCDHGHDDHEHHACGHCHDEHGHAHHDDEHAHHNDDEHAHHNSEDGCTHAHHDSEDGCTHACHDGDSGHAHTHHDSSHAHTHHDSSRAPHTEECHEHHHADEGHSCCDHSHDHHEHHHADEVFMSWGKETPHKYEKSVIEHALKVLSETEEYGTILRAKGMVESVDGSWIYFDMVPGEYELRQGQPEYTGRLCVIGCSLAEERLLDLFEI